MTAYCNINGQLVENSAACIPVQDRGFRFGDGVFETIAVAEGVPYQFEWHHNRLERGLNSLKIHYDTTGLRGHCRALLHKNACTEGFLRIQITRGVGGKGYLPDHVRPSLVIETLPPAEAPPPPIHLWQSTYRKVSPHALPVQYKLCQGLNSTLARIEAQEHGCFEALLQNEQAQLCETSSGNIFLQKNDIIYTPALDCGILEGSTRAAILRLQPSVQEVRVTLEQLVSADAACITNVAWKVLPVSELRPVGAHWQSEALAGRLSQLLDLDRQHYIKTHYQEWRQ